MKKEKRKRLQIFFVNIISLERCEMIIARRKRRQWKNTSNIFCYYYLSRKMRNDYIKNESDTRKRYKLIFLARFFLKDTKRIYQERNDEKVKDLN